MRSGLEVSAIAPHDSDEQDLIQTIVDRGFADSIDVSVLNEPTSFADRLELRMAQEAEELSSFS
jgi:hypothetical protein